MNLLEVVRRSVTKQVDGWQDSMQKIGTKRKEREKPLSKIFTCALMWMNDERKKERKRESRHSFVEVARQADHQTHVNVVTFGNVLLSFETYVHADIQPRNNNNNNKKKKMMKYKEKVMKRKKTNKKNSSESIQQVLVRAVGDSNLLILFFKYTILIKKRIFSLFL